MLLFVSAAIGSWARRADHVQARYVTLHAEGVSVIEVPGIGHHLDRETPDAVARTGLSAVWEAAPVAGVSYTGNSGAVSGALPRTPAGEVERWVRRLSLEQRADTRAALQRMARYEPLIHHALRERGLPTDLLYLALIESGFSPRATSRAGAAGIWQFMPATARAHGLEVSEYVDERRDPVRSTYAAVEHLRWLHQQFGSWHLAAAAYNAGGGRVDRLLRELLGTGGGDETLYWRIRSVLPAETREYVPKLLAAARVARSPESHGLLSLEPLPPLRFRELMVEGGVPLELVAARLGVADAELTELNPHLVRGQTPPGRRWQVRVPAELRTDLDRMPHLTP